MKTLKNILLLIITWGAVASPCLAWRNMETDTFLTRDPAGFVDGPNQYTYVRQNPATHFDPEGLMIEANTTTRIERRNAPSIDNGVIVPGTTNVTVQHTHMKFTASLIDGTGKLKDPREMEKIRERITKSITDQYTGHEENHEYDIEVDIKVCQSAKDIRKGDHEIRIVNDVPDTNALAPAQAAIGSNLMYIRADILDSTLKRGGERILEYAVSHEFGHLAGLFHPKDMTGPFAVGGQAGYIDDVYQHSKQGYSDNIMDGTGGKNLTPSQIDRIQQLYNNSANPPPGTKSPYDYINRDLNSPGK